MKSFVAEYAILPMPKLTSTVFGTGVIIGNSLIKHISGYRRGSPRQNRTI